MMCLGDGSGPAQPEAWNRSARHLHGPRLLHSIQRTMRVELLAPEAFELLRVSAVISKRMALLRMRLRGLNRERARVLAGLHAEVHLKPCVPRTKPLLFCVPLFPPS
jgi:hypothetical protein